MKYCYKNSLEAAYMQVEHEMQILEACGMPIRWVTGYGQGGVWSRWEYDGGDGYIGNNWCIHPNSNTILSPRTGDLCEGNNTNPRYFEYDDISTPEMVSRILMRNGKPFYTPAEVK